MKVIPAIDIKDGQCVRLFQGDYNQVTTYDPNPVNVAKRWEAAGAEWLHLVDLDGAKVGQPINLDLIGRIKRATSMRIELGGGIRKIEQIEQLIHLGIERVILGTVAITDRQVLDKAIEWWGERIVVGLDARNGLVAIAGWRETSEVQATDLARELTEAGVQRFIYTDIVRDGAMRGPNLDALREMQRATSSALIASGGVSKIEDLRELVALGVEGVIVGKAIYTGDIDLAFALQELGKV